MIAALSIGARVGIIGAIVAMLLGAGAVIHHKIFQSGYDRAVHDVAVKNKGAIDAVDKVLARVRDCDADSAMRWDQVAGECVRRD